MRRTLLSYALMTVVLAVVIVVLAWRLAAPADARGVWIGTAVAGVVQLGAFALLLYGRARARLFIASWLGGMILRILTLGGVAFWVTRSATLPPPATLLSLAGFLFLLLLMEPLFLRKRLRPA